MNVAVLGDGGWGTALALALLRNGHAPRVWGPAEDSGEFSLAALAASADTEPEK